jgi:hypothetical protein
VVEEGVDVVTAEDTPVEVGQVWRAKRESYRTVTITYVYESGQLGVRRNTSRRTQSISPTTLRKGYRLDERSKS